MWTKKSAKTIRKQVRGCLQNLYQSVAIHLKYVLFGTLITSTKVFSLAKVFDKTILYLDIVDYVPRDLTILTKFVSIGSYSREVRTFGTLITSTKVFSLIIICKSL